MSNLLTVSKKFVKKNGSTILTVLGAAGVVGTAVMAVKATPKAIELIEQAKEEKGEELTKWETIQVAGPTYIPSILLGTVTITSIFGANLLSRRTQASLMSAYALLDQTHKEYKNKVKELYGEDGDKLIRTAVAKDNYDEEDEEEYEDEYDDGKTLFYDEFSKRYYRVTNETQLRAEYEINKMLSETGGASLNDYYDLLEIDRQDYGEFMGWSAAKMYELYWDSWLHFRHTKVEMDDGMECWIIDYTEPFIDYEEY